MGIGDKLTNEVTAWGTLAIVIVIISVVLLKFKSNNPANITCDGGLTFNVSANNCYNSSGSTFAINSVGSTLDTFVSALSEPKNWVAIVIIAIIGFAVLAIFMKKRK